MSSTGKQTLGTIAVAVISGVLTNAVWEMPWADWSRSTSGKCDSGVAFGAAAFVLLFYLSDVLGSWADELQERNRPVYRMVWGLYCLNGLVFAICGYTVLRWIFHR